MPFPKESRMTNLQKISIITFAFCATVTITRRVQQEFDKTAFRQSIQRTEETLHQLLAKERLADERPVPPCDPPPVAAVTRHKARKPPAHQETPETAPACAPGTYVILKTGERLHVTAYQVLGDKYRLQLQGGWVDINMTDVAKIEECSFKD